MKAWPISLRFAALAFLPVSIALVAGFALFSGRIDAELRSGLAGSLAEAGHAQGKVRAAFRQQQRQLVTALAENATLKAGLTLWREASRSEEARRTVEGVVAEVGASLDADLLALTDAEGRVAAILERQGKELAAVHERALAAPSGGARLIEFGGSLYDSTAVPLNNDAENLGFLLLGKRLDLGSYHSQAALVRRGVVERGVGFGKLPGLAAALGRCGGQGDCATTFDGRSFVALAADRELGGGYEVWTLHPLDQAANQILGAARTMLWVALAGLLAAAFLADYFGARTVTRPLEALIGGLRESERAGVLRGDFPENSSTREVNDLAHAFNLAARSVADSQRQLDEAYLQITQTMAQTLDARDPYTAGHSSRVSQYAVAIAEAMNLPAKEVDVIRAGATFHDIGKIGIPDAVLQKPGRLTAEEFAVIAKHPVIGKRILEGVAKFHEYLAIVELHHENHDGSGYPWGLSGEKVPLGARIVHVVDAFDAMTTNRPYRQGMAPEKALSILRAQAGTQFDPAVVEVFLRSVQADPSILPPAAPARETGPIGEQLRELGRELEKSHETHVAG